MLFSFRIRTTNQASNLAKSMCHDILKEDDEAASLDGNTTESSDANVLDEQNGNIDAKLANLSLADTVKTVNGNNGNDKTGITKANHKSEAKNGANVVNNNGDNGAATDSNDNNGEISGHRTESDGDKIANAGDLIKDDATVVH